MQKKLFALLLSVAMLLSACSNQSISTDTVGEEITEVNDQESDEDSEGAVVTETEPEEAETKEVVEAAVPEKETPDYTKGMSDENGWDSKWIGIRFTAPEDFIMYTEEELNNLMGISQDLLSEDFSELQSKYEELTSVTEMVCTTPTGAPNVAVATEKMMVKITQEQYIDALRQTFAQITAMNYTLAEDTEVVTIGGKEFTKLCATADSNGTVFSQDYYMLIQGDRMISLVVTYTDDTAEQAQALLDCFEEFS